MMSRYILDANILFANLDDLGVNRYDLILLDDIVDEIAPYPDRLEKLKNAGVCFAKLEKRHYEKMKQVMSEHGADFQLIRLFSNKGKADPVLISYILTERELNTLFDIEYILVTNDARAKFVAESYKIKCQSSFPKNTNTDR